MLRVAWWLFFGFIAVLEIYRLRSRLPDFLRSLRAFSWLVGIWIATLFASSLYSPSPLFTFANASLMAILALASLDLGLKLHSGILDVRRALKICFGFSIALLAIFTLTLFLAPDLVGTFSQAIGLRARGGQVADSALLSQIVFFIGIYLASVSSGISQGAYRFIVLVSPAFLLIAQTRTMYVSFFVGSMIFFWKWLIASKSNQCRATMVGMLCLAVSGITGFALYDEVSRTLQVFASVEEYLLRGRESLQGMNSRDGLAAILTDRVASQPWGLGYSAGPRHVLLTISFDELRQHGIYHKFAGNAHNMYLEVLAGSGFLGAGAWLALLLWLLIKVWQIRDKAVIPVQVLLLVVLLGGITESYGALPFYQPSALLWILASFITGLKGKYLNISSPNDSLHHMRPDRRKMLGNFYPGTKRLV